jgi:hypothetical protein
LFRWQDLNQLIGDFFDNIDSTLPFAAARHRRKLAIEKKNATQIPTSAILA